MKPRILLRSSWQTVNIGDIGHTPGALRIFENLIPDAAVTLWPNDVGRGVREQLLQRWAALQIVTGDIGPDGLPDTPELARAFSECQIFVHGSGPQLMSPHHVDAWRRTGKPYGFLGITIDPLAFGAGGDWEGGTLDELHTRIEAMPPGSMNSEQQERLAASNFLFLRDTLSLAHVRCQVPGLHHADFSPDMTFACDLRDDRRAEEFLAQHALEPGMFLCVIPRLRWTPYHRIHNRPASEADLAKDAVNARTVESDHEPLRQAIIRWVRETGLKVLACPEMTYEIQLAKEQLIAPLPDDVRPHVVWKDTYWLNDEATAVYRHARAMISLENHSPILALAQGVPVLFLRQPTDTIKGQMWHDLGLDPFFFEIENASGPALWEQLSRIHNDYPAAQEHVRALMQRVRSGHNAMAGAVIQALE